MFWIGIALSILLAVVSYMLRPKPPSPPNQAVNLPTFQEGTPIQYGFGTYQTAPQLIWPTSRDTMLKNQGGSGRWTMSWAECYGWGPIKTILATRWLDQSIISTPSNWDPTRTPYGSVTYNNVGMGDTITKVDKNGDSTTTIVRASGTMRFWFGVDNQAPDPFMAAIVATNEAEGNQLTPCYRHLAYAVYQKTMVGFSPTVPQSLITLVRVPQCPVDDTGANGMKSAYIMNSSGQANPIAVLMDLACNTVYGAGMDISQQDWPTLNAVAETLFNEGRMISGCLQTADQFRNFIKTLESHIDGLITEQDGVMSVRLIRYDYDPGSVPVVPAGDIVDVPDVEDGDPGQVFNYLGITYSAQAYEFQTITIPIVDVPNLMETRQSKRTTLDLPWFTSPAIVTSVGVAKAQQLMIARDTVVITVRRRSAYAFQEGDVVRFTRPSANLDDTRIFRIMKIERAAYNKKFAKLSCVEEVGNITHALSAPQGGTGGTGTGGPGWLLTPLSAEMPLELPYAFNPTSQVLCTYLCDREDGSYSNFELWNESGTAGFDDISDGGLFVFAGAGTYDAGGLDVDDDGFVIDNLKLNFDWEQFLATTPTIDRASLYKLVRLAVLCPDTNSPLVHEIVAFQTATVETTDPDTGNPTSIRLSGVIRGLFDTKRLSGPLGVFILPNGAMPFVAGPRIDWYKGQVVTFKAVPYNSQWTAEADLMDTRVFTLQERSNCPYAVANLAVDGDGSMPRFTTGTSARLSWTARSRVAGCGINDSFANNAGIETGTDFVVRLYDNTGAQIGTDNIVPSTQTVVDARGVTRFYFDFTIGVSLPYVTAKVNSRLASGAYESVDPFDTEELQVIAV